MANPWYGIEGLGQGLLQGYMVGADVRERRRREKQEQMREVLMMLYPAIKSDPQAVKQMEPYLKQVLGPKFQMPAIKPQEQQEQEAITQRLNFIKQKMPWLSDREAGIMAMGYAPPKPQTEGQQVEVPTPWGNIKVKPEAALRYQQFMQGQQPKPLIVMGPEGLQQIGNVPHGAVVRNLPQVRGGAGIAGSETETATPWTPQEIEVQQNLEKVLLNPKADPQQRELAKQRYEAMGGAVTEKPVEKESKLPSWLGGGKYKSVETKLTPPTTKKKVVTKGGAIPSGPNDVEAIKKKAEQLIKQGKDPEMVRAWLKSKGVAVD